MLTITFGALVKQLNIVNKYRNLCNLLFKSMNNVYFNTKFVFFLAFLISAFDALINMTPKNCSIFFSLMVYYY
jgi:hypothetical protein